MQRQAQAFRYHTKQLAARWTAGALVARRCSNLPSGHHAAIRNATCRFGTSACGALLRQGGIPNSTVAVRLVVGLLFGGVPLWPAAVAAAAVASGNRTAVMAAIEAAADPGDDAAIAKAGVAAAVGSAGAAVNGANATGKEATVVVAPGPKVPKRGGGAGDGRPVIASGELFAAASLAKRCVAALIDGALLLSLSALAYFTGDRSS